MEPRPYTAPARGCPVLLAVSAQRINERHPPRPRTKPLLEERALPGKTVRRLGRPRTETASRDGRTRQGQTERWHRARCGRAAFRPASYGWPAWLDHLPFVEP